jgi:7-cyano-7-deazaguanine synthase
MKVIVITSGGMDSTVLAHWHRSQGDTVSALAIDYGQRHRQELFFAAKQAEKLGVPFTQVDLRSLKQVLRGSSQTDDSVAVPHGHYAEENMKVTVVPNRNMILLSVALAQAISLKFDVVSYAAHAGDHAIYPDCRPEFVDAMNGAAKLCDWQHVEIVRPFIHKTKADIVRIGHAIGVDFAKTYSCYEGTQSHCGRCGTCVERKEAFEHAEVFDPTFYTDARPSSEVLASLAQKS